MAMSNLSEIERKIHDVIGDLSDHLRWSWDGRFDAALTEFPAGDKEKILGLLKPRFDSLWDAASVAGAPPRLFELCQSIGGLRPGQLLFATEPEGEILLLGAWWPWGNQKTISLRIIPTALDCGQQEFEQFVESFKGWFGL